MVERKANKRNLTITFLTGLLVILLSSPWANAIKINGGFKNNHQDEIPTMLAEYGWDSPLRVEWIQRAYRAAATFGNGGGATLFNPNNDKFYLLTARHLNATSGNINGYDYNVIGRDWSWMAPDFTVAKVTDDLGNVIKAAQPLHLTRDTDTHLYEIEFLNASLETLKQNVDYIQISRFAPTRNEAVVLVGHGRVEGAPLLNGDGLQIGYQASRTRSKNNFALSIIIDPQYSSYNANTNRSFVGFRTLFLDYPYFGHAGSGDSGGLVINLAGELIGTMIAVSRSGVDPADHPNDLAEQMEVAEYRKSYTVCAFAYPWLWAQSEGSQQANPLALDPRQETVGSHQFVWPIDFRYYTGRARSLFGQIIEAEDDYNGDRRSVFYEYAFNQLFKNLFWGEGFDKNATLKATPLGNDKIVLSYTRPVGLKAIAYTLEESINGLNGWSKVSNTVPEVTVNRHYLQETHSYTITRSHWKNHHFRINVETVTAPAALNEKIAEMKKNIEEGPNPIQFPSSLLPDADKLRAESNLLHHSLGKKIEE